MPLTLNPFNSHAWGQKPKKGMHLHWKQQSIPRKSLHFDSRSPSWQISKTENSWSKKAKFDLLSLYILRSLPVPWSLRCSSPHWFLGVAPSTDFSYLRIYSSRPPLCQDPWGAPSVLPYCHTLLSTQHGIFRAMTLRIPATTIRTNTEAPQIKNGPGFTYHPLSPLNCRSYTQLAPPQSFTRSPCPHFVPITFLIFRIRHSVGFNLAVRFIYQIFMWPLGLWLSSCRTYEE